MVLKNTDLIVATGETQIGTLDTTQDAQANNAATGGTLYGENLYTSDERTRADFKTIGSVIEVNKGRTGDVVHATDMKLSDATLLKLDVAVNNDGSVISDRIAATGTVNAAAATGLNSTSTATAPSTARVFANLDVAAAASAAEGARTTILTGTLAAPINEDVLYEVKKAANGTYQRTLQNRNMHLENKDARVDLVFSKNYRSAAKTAPMQKVAEAIRQYSDAFHHSEGWLAASDDRMAKLVDAFDYTRSEAAAQRGLQSLAGTGNVLPQLMLFDSSRHHLNQLRKQMEMPVCPRTGKGAPTRKSNAWLAYTGAYDSLNGDANMGDYTRSAHGAMMGVDTALTCKLRAGLSLGYETASGEADSAKVDTDTIFMDAYATAYTGHIKHRASIGLALTSFDSRRGVEVEAGYHSFHGSARSDTDALTLNFGYEISSDYKLSERSWLTRYAAINLAWHNLDDMKESGLGEIGLVSEYDSEWQAGVAVGLAYNREFAAVKYEAPAVFSAHAAVHFELLADKATVNNRFSGLEGSWEAHSMDREQLYLELGVGVMVPLSPAWTATAGAAVEVGADRSAFSGNVGVRYAFCWGTPANLKRPAGVYRQAASFRQNGHERVPAQPGFADGFCRHRGGKLPGEGHTAFEVSRQQVVKINAAALEGGSVVAAGPLHIVHVGTVEVGLQLPQVLGVVQQQKVVLALNVAEVVPIAHVRVIRKLSHEAGHFPLARHLLEVAAAFHPQHQVELFRFLGQGMQSLAGALIVKGGLADPAAHQLTLAQGVFTAAYAFLPQHALQLAGGVNPLHELHVAHMQHHVTRAQAGGHQQRFQREPHRAFPRFRAVGSEGVGVRHIAHHLNGGGAEVVDSCHFDAPAIHRLEKPGHHIQAQTVGGFDILEAQLADFIAHGGAVLVAAAVPAGGKDVHEEYCRGKPRYTQDIIMPNV